MQYIYNQNTLEAILKKVYSTVVNTEYGPRNKGLYGLAKTLHIGEQNANRLTIAAGYEYTLRVRDVSEEAFMSNANVLAIGKLIYRKNKFMPHQ